MATTSMETKVDLDWISRGILVALNDNGGTATTSKIKKDTGVTKGTKVPYRLKNKLAPAGLVEVTRPGLNENGESLPLEHTLTDPGQKLAGQLEDSEDIADTPDVTDHIEMLNARVERFETQLDHINKDTDTDGPDPANLQEQITDLNRKLEALYRSMARFRDYLNERDNGGYSEYAEQHSHAEP